MAFTEGAERALIRDYAAAGQRATAFGLYHMISGLLVLPGALLFGALWQWFGEMIAFLNAASLRELAVTIPLLIAYKKPH